MSYQLIFNHPITLRRYREKYLHNKQTFNNKYAKHLKCKYNLTITQYNNLLQMQNGVCAICNKKQIYKNKKRLCVDHSHKTNKIYGLLCNNCNTALGLLKENINIAKNLVKYLKKKL